MATEKLAFLARWSRLKRQPKAPAVRERAAPSTPLPPLESLTPESDFSVFMGDSVESAVRRAALKKLFGDPRFNVPDLFEPFSGDWTGGEAIPEEMLRSLSQARSVLFRKEEEAAASPPSEQPPAQEPATGEHDDDGKQDA